MKGTSKHKFLFPAACLALFLTPGLVLAQNECGPQVGSIHVVCDGDSYVDGVTYDALGDLFIDFTADPTTEVESGGIDLSATGSDSITFDSASTATEIESRSTTGPLLDVSTSSGDIDIATEEMDADGQFPQNVTHAIRAMSNSGDINISTSGTVDAAGSNPADAIGIEAATGGSGTLTITASGAVSGNDAAIDASAASGLLTINVTGGSGTVGQSSDTGIRTNAGGDAIVNIASGRTVSGGLDLTAAGETTLNNSGSINFGGITAAGNAFTLNNNGSINGVIDLSSLSGGYTINNNAGATLSPGGDVINLGAGSLNNAGTIDLDGSGAQVLSAPGTTFAGTSNSVLVMEVLNPSTIVQTSCSTITVADCLDLTGGATAGQTAIRVDTFVVTDSTLNPLADPLKVVNPGIVLVDVSGGTSQADDFVLDPGSDDYVTDPVYGAVLDTGGLVDYTLLYNPNTQQHILASVPQREGVEYVTFIHEALSIWHTTSDAVAGRQADLRQGAFSGGWVRIVGEVSERDSTPSMTTHGNTFDYEQNYSLYTGAAIGGFDVLSDDDYVLGVHGGLISSRLTADASPTRDRSKGATFGVYGGWWQDGLTLDGTINLNALELDHNVSGHENSSTNIVSLGARAEAGWRMAMGEHLYVQPLATAAYVNANFDRLDLRYYDLSFKNTESSRAAVGVRLGGDTTARNDGRVNYWIVARAWEEFEGDGNVQYATDGDPLTIEDDLSGSFQELGFGVSASNKEDTLTGFLSGGLTSGNDTDTYNFSVGARLHW